MLEYITPKYEHTRIGNFLFKIGASWAYFMLDHRILYYFTSIIWNFAMTLVGTLCAAALGVAALFDNKITFHKYYWIYYIKVGPDLWGGMDASLMFLRDQKSTEEVNEHEWGHSLSQSFLGPLFIFLVALPSVFRWWQRWLFPKKNWKPYDAFWAEDLATQTGKYATRFLNILKESGV